MGSALPTPVSCPICGTTVSVSTPGPQGVAGANGANGTNGTNGVNPFTALTAQFTMPAVGANVVVHGVDFSWAFVGLYVLVENGGYMVCVSKASGTQITLQNPSPALAGNVTAGTVIPNASAVTAAGCPGGMSGAAGGDLKGTYPNPKISKANAKGATIFGDGTDAQTQTVGANGTRWVADSSKTLGGEYRAVDLASEVTGVTPVANGGTGSGTAAAARAALGIIAIQGRSLFRDSKGTGNSGGSFTGGAWQQRTLNSTVYNGISGASLAANIISLQAGTYRFRISAPAFEVNRHQIRLKNIDDVTYYYGSSEYSGAAAQTRSFLDVTITIAAPKTFQLEHRAETDGAGGAVATGFGTPTSFGAEENYSSVYIEQL